MTFHEELNKALAEGKIPEKTHKIFGRLYETYANSLHADDTTSPFNPDPIFHIFLEKVIEQVAHPHRFSPFHQSITSPFDYYSFGIDFLRPLVDFEKSKNLFPKNVDKIQEQLKRQENVILFANHQTELDPQLISLMFDDNYPGFAKEMVFVAGDRVITDPMAIPFSMGRNLLCIYSKKYIDTPPEKKEEKQNHNKRVMKLMSELFAEGGKCIYVAPSGGRDRPDEKGEVNVAPFDPHSIEMFRLMASRAKRKVHFYPLALATYDILPPPNEVQQELGEDRVIYREGAGFAFCDEIDMETFPGSEETNKHAKRLALAKHIFDEVKAGYAQLKENS